jgi:hypothetical protein
VENRKVGSSVVFFVGDFLAQIKDEHLFFAKNFHYANFQRDQRRSGWKKAFFEPFKMK